MGGNSATTSTEVAAFFSSACGITLQPRLGLPHESFHLTTGKGTTNSYRPLLRRGTTSLHKSRSCSPPQLAHEAAQRKRPWVASDHAQAKAVTGRSKAFVALFVAVVASDYL